MASITVTGIQLDYTGQQVDDAIRSEGVSATDSVAGLAEITPPSSRVIKVDSLDYEWVAGDTTTADGLLVVESLKVGYRPGDANEGRWIARFSGPIYAEWFGVVADYVPSTEEGTDNTTALRNAVAAAESGGYELILPAGNIKITGTIDFTANGMIMRGAGKWKTRIYPRDFGVATLTPVLNLEGDYAITSPAQTVLRDFSIWGGDNTADDPDLLGIYIEYGSNFVFCDNVMVNYMGEGWRLFNCWQMTFKDCGGNNNVYNGLLGGWHIDDNRLTQPSSSFGLNALRFLGGRFASNGLHGMQLGPGANNVLMGTDLEGNNGCGLRSLYQHGMSLTTSYCENVTAHAGAWTTSTAYSVGDIVTYTYGGQTATFVCHTAHTSSSGNSPDTSMSIYDVTRLWHKRAGYYFFSGRNIGIVGTEHNIWEDDDVLYWFDSTYAFMGGSSLSRGTDASTAQDGLLAMMETASVTCSAPDIRAIKTGFRLMDGSKLILDTPNFVGVDWPISCNSSSTNYVAARGINKTFATKCNFGQGIISVVGVSDNGSGKVRCDTDATFNGMSSSYDERTMQVYIQGAGVYTDGLYTATYVDDYTFDLEDITYSATDTFEYVLPHRVYGARDITTHNEEERWVDGITGVGTHEFENVEVTGYLGVRGTSPASQGEVSGGSVEFLKENGTGYGLMPAIASYWSGADNDQEGLIFYVHDSATFSDPRIPGMYLTSDADLQVEGGFGANGVTPAAQSAHVADPSGGATVDAEARTAINAILVTLENHGLHATS